MQKYVGFAALETVQETDAATPISPEETRAAAQTEFYKRLIVQLKASKHYNN